ncbi:MAG TPA: IS110 family transposase [Anaerolineales bacterium]
MEPETTCKGNDTTEKRQHYMALEMSQKEWKLGFSVGAGQAPRLRSEPGRDVRGLKDEIRLARERFRLGEGVEVESCYEAGRDGFWLHRYLEAQGVKNLVVDSASIEVSRRFRRVKTDRMDVGKLLGMLMRYQLGEKKVWSVVHVPSAGAEDERQLHREMMALKRERTRHINRVKGLLAGQGVVIEVGAGFLEEIGAVRLWDGSGLGGRLRKRLEREYERMELLKQQIGELEKEREEVIRTSQEESVEQVRRLLQLKGIGVNSAWLYVMEFFAWRGFRNRREVGSLAGLRPTPYQSGESSNESGISKAGNRPVRGMAIEIAWAWLRYQPESALSLWYNRRCAEGSSRVRRIGIVALARKLLIELWKYLETGAVPEGAYLKSD